MQHNIGLLELLFTGVGVLVMPLVLMAFPDMHEDCVIAKRARRDILPRVVPALEVKYQQARDNRSEGIDRILILAWCVAIGTRLMTQPPSTRGGDITLTSVMFSFGIIMVELLVARRAIITMLTRRKQLRTLSDPKKSKEETIQAIIQKRQRADDPPPTKPEDDCTGL